jgi:hypothetical protein
MNNNGANPKLIGHSLSWQRNRQLHLSGANEYQLVRHGTVYAKVWWIPTMTEENSNSSSPVPLIQLAATDDCNE